MRLEQALLVASTALLGCPSLDSLNVHGPDGSPADASPRDAAADGTRDAHRLPVDASSPDVEAGPACIPLPLSDASAADASICSADATCKPGPLGGFAPDWHPPHPPTPACTAAQIAQFVSECVSQPQSVCETFSTDPMNFTCLSCLITPETNAQYGPLVEVSTYDVLSRAGCIALLEPCNLPCAMAWQAEDQCGAALCDGVCPYGTPSNVDCVNTADDCQCAKWTDPASSCGNALIARGSPAAQCFMSNLDDAVTEIATLFCGGK